MRDKGIGFFLLVLGFWGLGNWFVLSCAERELGEARELMM